MEMNSMAVGIAVIVVVIVHDSNNRFVPSLNTERGSRVAAIYSNKIGFWQVGVFLI